MLFAQEHNTAANPAILDGWSALLANRDARTEINSF
jgi:hypothetical protein